MTYTAPLRDIRFCLDHVVGAGRLARTELFVEADGDLRSAILEEAGKLSSDVLAPLNQASDLEGARLENGAARCTPGFSEAYARIAEGGWVGISAPVATGGMGLPLTLASAVNEMMASGCLSLSLCSLMSQGAIETLDAHAAGEIKALYLPRIVSGEWTGTMNLTEPQAGSDVGAIKTRAAPNGDGSYAITGQKIFISWGDHDVARNIVHLVLARLPGAPEGTRGISLFIVPKFIPDADGAPGARNGARAVSFERKLGLHGSPTAVMAYEDATGWLIGDENKGMACMFTMMNNARLGVGVQGVAVAEAAYQAAAAYALIRRQGRTPTKDGAVGNGAIIEHADVRRMLLNMKALTEIARAICYDCALHLDLARAAASEEERRAARDMSAFLTPIAKAFGADVGCEAAHLGIQVHGGMGYIEETGAAQYLRDVRVTAIYEGANGIQAMDLVGRKLSIDGGATARVFLAWVRETAEALNRAGEPFKALSEAAMRAIECAQRATDWMLAAEPNDRNAGAAAYLRLLALTAGADYLGRGALATASNPAAGDQAGPRIALARFHAARLVPQTTALAIEAMQGAAGLYAFTDEDFGA